MPYILGKQAILKRRFFPVERIEVLDNPTIVLGWESDGLILQSGDTLPVPGIAVLPTLSKALSEATRTGSDIASDGRITALVLVHHWCGNDPVRKHIAKVDLSDFQAFTLAGYEYISEPALAGLWPYPALDEAHFSEWGWDFTQFDKYQDSLPFQVEP